MKSDRLGQSSSSRSGLSGSNDDSSVVSLKALVAKVEPQSPATRSATFDDSGLIDLKKLMAEAPPPSSRALPPVLAPSEAGLFAIPEPTLSPHLATTMSLPEDATTNKFGGRSKWLAVAGVTTMLAIAATVGVMRSQAPAAQQDANTTPVMEAANASQPPADPTLTAPVVPAVPAATAAPPTTPEPRTDATQARPNRQASVNNPTRDRGTRESPAVVKNKVEDKSVTAAACDLRCEIERAAKKQKSK